MGLAHDTSYNLVVTLQEGYKCKLNFVMAFATKIHQHLAHELLC
jgi:hypothetical protein